MKTSTVNQETHEEECADEEIEMYEEPKLGNSFTLCGNLKEFDEPQLEMDNSFDWIINSFKNRLSGKSNSFNFNTTILDQDNCNGFDFEVLSHNSESSFSKRSKNDQDDDAESFKSYRSADEIEAKFRSARDHNEMGQSHASSYSHKLPSESQGGGLRSISCRTLSQILNGEFQENIASFNIIDCRYPYEFEGGHINSSTNLFNLEQAVKFLFSARNDDTDDKMNFLDKDFSGFVPNFKPSHILILHCEFSVNRAP
ncbi:MAG: M-phase inducer phosphatase 1, partial [Marteilia pararefringens]